MTMAAAKVGSQRAQREELAASRRIAVPGCNVTAVTLAVQPGIAAGLLDPSRLTAVLALMAAAAQTTRVVRWHGWRVGGDPIALSLHAAYTFIPLGLAGISLAAEEEGATESG